MHPHWRIDKLTKLLLRTSTTDAVHRYFGSTRAAARAEQPGDTNHAPLDRDDIEVGARKAVNMLTATLAKDRYLPKDELVPSLAATIMERDAHFLFNPDYPGGRPRPPIGQDVAGVPAVDPNLSHICRYALAGHSTHDPDYDRMFAEIGEFLRNLTPERIGLAPPGDDRAMIDHAALWSLVERYNATHPDDTVSMPTIPRTARVRRHGAR